MNPLWHGLLGFTIGVLGFISITGNGMVIYIFSTTKVSFTLYGLIINLQFNKLLVSMSTNHQRLFQSLKTPSNLLVVNLAFSDFLMMCAMSPAMVINCYNETWMFGKSRWEIKFEGT